MLMPKRVKFRKVSKGNRSGYATSGTELAYGEFGLKALTRGLLTATQIEACRVAINREMKRKGKLAIGSNADKLADLNKLGTDAAIDSHYFIITNIESLRNAN